MISFDWESEIRNWCNRRRDITPPLTDSVVVFFRKSFENTLCPNRAWFGIHSSGVSLVVGGIYLSAIHRTGSDKGLWLLLSQTPPPIEGVSQCQVMSSRDLRRPLIWAHAKSLAVIHKLVGSVQLWESFRAASQQVLTASRSATDRDATQERRGKRRLSEFWSDTSVGVFPDEVSPAWQLVEGAACKVTVNAYERDREARRQCIEAHRPKCCVCEFDFGAVYGPEFAGFIHVHHLRPLSEVRGEYIVDPVADLRPVCPNCHAVIHFDKKLRKIEEVRQLLARQRQADSGRN